MEALISDDNVTEAKSKVYVPVLDSNQIDNCSVDSVHSVSNHVSLHLACISDRYWVGVDHAVAFLEDRVAASCGFFLAFVSDQVLLEGWVHNKARPNIKMVVLSVYEIRNYLRWWIFFLFALSEPRSPTGEIDLLLAIEIFGSSV